MQFMWPENLECSKFPEDGTDICISPNVTSPSSSSSSSSPSSGHENHHFDMAIATINQNERKNNDIANTTVYTHRFRGFVCPVQLKGELT